MAMTPLQQKFHRLIRATNVFDDGFYRRNNPDVVPHFADLLEHYILSGEREGRAPTPFFDPGWYRLQAPRLRPEDNMLAHYLTVGDRDGFQPMPGFDPKYVRQQLGSRLEPALVGFLRARTKGKLVNPSRFFDYRHYYTTYPDILEARIDGFYHFVYVGADEGREPAAGISWFVLREKYQLTGTNAQAFRSLMLRWRHLDDDSASNDNAPSILLQQEEIRSNHKPSELYESHDAPPPGGRARRADVYAFYLTQFHRFAENDAWWGEGFTEWHNVVRGVPRFSGHYQPRIPSALGFYDLDDPRVMPTQVALAKQAGLAGFAFYYYHFGQQRLLERPLDNFLYDKSLDIGFFLIWANETWSRRWDGSESEILLEQTYPPQMPEMLALDLARYFADPRYRRVDGRPLFVIYRVGSIPDAVNWLARLRSAFRAIGENPIIYLAQTFEDIDPLPYGLDGAMEFPPHKYSRSLRLLQPQRLFGANAALKVWDYRDFMRVALADPDPDFPLIRGCFPAWDNDSRRQGASSIIHGSTPAKFRGWLKALADKAEAPHTNGSPPIVVINAWNEWGEGAYLEPDRHYGYAYLNAVQAVLNPEAAENVRRLVLVGHDAFVAGAQRLLLHIGQSLKADFGIRIVFVLLRGDPGYDGLLEEYRGTAETIVAGADIGLVMMRLAARGFAHAIVNSAASSAALDPVLAAGIAAIQLIHELPAMFAGLGAQALIEEAAGRMRRFVAPTQAIEGMLKRAGVPGAQIRQLPQGQYRRVVRVDREEARTALLGGDEERQVVVGLGFGDKRKGVDLFVAACEAAQATQTPMLFIWQGDWDRAIETALSARTELLEATGIFQHLPNSSDIDTLLGAADIFFLPSREDPLPSAAIEAWSVGLPIVALEGGGGISDLIAGNAELGILTDSGDPPTLLAGLKAAGALGRSEERANWARSQYDWPTYISALLREVYAPPAVDVAIVGHNHGRFAEPRMTSLIRQTLPPRRIVYHDVASTDGSPAAIRAVARRVGIDFVDEAANEGRLFDTWLAVARASDAEYFHIAEGDDWIAPAMIERCVEALEAAPEAAFAFVGIEWIDTAGNVIADHCGYPASIIGPEVADGGEILPDVLLASAMTVRNPVLSVSSVIWRRAALLKILEANGPSFERLDFAFDWLLYLRAAKSGYSATFVPQPLCRHRQHADSFASRDDLSRHADEIRRLYKLVPAPKRKDERQAYLKELG